MEDFFTRIIEKTLKAANIIFLSVMTITIIIQVISRYLFSNSFDWTEEVGRLMLVWMTFCGATIIFMKLEHPSIDLFVKLFPSSIRKSLKVVGFVLIGVFLIYALVGGVKVLRVSKIVSSVALGFPMTLVYLSFFLNGLIMLAFNLMFLLKTFKEKSGQEG
jgi:TRAP-type C4-dicarboxylate transport system permease small subunit